MATTTGSSLPTRQQLDEIDTLLRRMLSLPALGTDPEPIAAAPATTYAPPNIREIPPAVPSAPGDPVVHSWRVEWPQAAPSAPIPQSTPGVAAWGWPVPAPGATAPYARAGRPAPGPRFGEAPPPSRLAPPIPGHLWPAVVVNWVFDASALLGPLGSWLRGSGRSVLGGSVLMILAAAGSG